MSRAKFQVRLKNSSPRTVMRAKWGRFALLLPFFFTLFHHFFFLFLSSNFLSQLVSTYNLPQWLSRLSAINHRLNGDFVLQLCFLFSILSSSWTTFPACYLVLQVARKFLIFSPYNVDWWVIKKVKKLRIREKLRVIFVTLLSIFVCERQF